MRQAKTLPGSIEAPVFAGKVPQSSFRLSMMLVLCWTYAIGSLEICGGSKERWDILVTSRPWESVVVNLDQGPLRQWSSGIVPDAGAFPATYVLTNKATTANLAFGAKAFSRHSPFSHRWPSIRVEWSPRWKTRGSAH